MPNKTEASVIIPVYNGSRCLGNCLHAIFDTDLSDFEVIVVNDGSSDDSSAIARQFPCMVIDLKENKGPSFARNVGVRRSSGRILLFTDSDCVVQKDWVRRMVAEHERLSAGDPSIVAIGARILPNRNFVSECAAYAGYYAFQHGDSVIDRPDLCSANLLVTREAFDLAGGFDETLINGEDNDLTCKLCDRGYRAVYDPFIFVVHEHRKTMLEFFRHQASWGRWHGLRLERRYARIRHLPAVSLIGNPWVYLFLLSIPVSLAITWRSIRANFRYEKKVLIYAPFIFISKLYYRAGVVQWLFQEQKEKVASQRVSAEGRG
jgi:O-antigen biosynthesis protein